MGPGEAGEPLANAAASGALGGVLAGILWLVARRGPVKIFGGRHGRRHRLAGAAYLAWLAAVAWAAASSAVPGGRRQGAAAAWLYDLVLGVLGTLLTFTAAHEFGSTPAHMHAVNAASGALEPETTITRSEMLEHGFYQLLNVVQVSYIHAASLPMPDPARWGLALAATAPWVLRARFPVNSFSANYTGKQAPKAGTLVGVLYRLKKWQYLLYKHALLHGLNVSLAAAGGRGLGTAPYFRLYWVSLNAAYTLEFFLQTLVKRGHMTQAHMLALNQLLMAGSTAAALQVVWRHVSVPAAALSLALNFARRHRELSNTALVLALAVATR